MSLSVYRRKRKFSQTPEPRGGKRASGKGALRFVVQLHRASRLHFDFRLEIGGTFKSWAVPKGPSLNPQDQRLAVQVEDHPLEYGSFEGMIPEGNYGAGTVMIWDEGTYVERTSKGREDSEAAMLKNLEKGHITFILDGEKLKGEFALVRIKKDAGGRSWLLVKKRDEYSTFKSTHSFGDLSVKTGRTMKEIAAQAEERGDIWLPRKGKQTAKETKKSAPPTKTAASSKASKRDKPARGNSRMPRRNRPMIATPAVARKPARDWIFDPDLEGLRALAEVEGKKVHLYSKSLLSFDKKYPEILEELKRLSHPMVLDGEIVRGRGKPRYHVYDLLFLKDQDLRDRPLKERKKLLETAVPDGKFVCRVKADKKAAGAVIAKDPESPYRAGTSKDWLKIGAPRDEAGPRLTHPDKIFFPEDKISKGDLFEYYRSISSYILPHLVDRPESLHRFPDGITKGGFFHKDMTGHLPRWLKTQRIFSQSTGKSIDYLLCQDERSLLYIVNLGCIEINPWFSRVQNLDQPDYLVIDLDPDGNSFKQVSAIALEVHELLEEIGAENHCKTSGATGVHIAVPTGARYDFDTVRAFAEAVCRLIARRHPATTSVERSPNRRRGKVYLDFLQNRRGQTLAAPYCVRPRAGAPVSMPVTWKELAKGLEPQDFHLGNALKRLEKKGDLWKPVLGPGVDLTACMKRLMKKA